MEYNVIIANKSEKERVYNYILKIDKEFPVALSEKTDIKEYVEKIFNNGVVVLAKKQDEIIGILTGYLNDAINKQGYISVLEVSDAYRGAGVAKALLNEFEKMASQAQISTIKLYTHKDNEGAKKFYLKNGYKIKNEQANYDYSIVLEKNVEVNMFNILLTSVGRRSYLVNYFKEALGESGEVHASNSTDITPAFRFADKTVKTPLIYDDTYIDFLKEYCVNNKIKAIISLFDIDLPVLAKHKHEFEEMGIKVIVSDAEVIDICNDKWKTHQFLKDNGFNTVGTYISLEEAMQDMKDGKINYPLMIKPRWGMGSLSVMQADDEEELLVYYKRAIKKIKQTYLKYESNQDMEQAVLIQEKIIGQEHGLDVINDLNGNYRTTIVKEKYAMRAGETDCAKVIDSSLLSGLGEKIANKLNHIGNMDVDVFMVDNEPYVLERNARFGGGYPFSHMSGVNLPKALVAWLKNEEIEGDVLMAKKFGVLFHKDITIVQVK